MHKKHFLLIMLSHLIVVLSLFAPLIRVSENRLNTSGSTIAETNTETNNLNIFQYVYNDIYTVTAVAMIILAVLSLVGIGTAVYGIVKKEVNTRAVKISFALSFSLSAMGALQMYSKSYVLFIICAVCFFVASICSIRLMKQEKY